MCFSIFKNGISGHSHQIKVENHEKLIFKTLKWEEAIVIFGFFRLFLINMESFRVQCFVPQFPEEFKDSWLDKSLGTFYERLKKYGTKNIKKVINLLSEYINIIHIWKEQRTSFPLQKTRSDLNDYKKRYKVPKIINIWLF